MPCFRAQTSFRSVGHFHSPVRFTWLVGTHLKLAYQIVSSHIARRKSSCRHFFALLFPPDRLNHCYGVPFRGMLRQRNWLTFDKHSTPVSAMSWSCYQSVACLCYLWAFGRHNKVNWIYLNKAHSIERTLVGPFVSHRKFVGLGVRISSNNLK